MCAHITVCLSEPAKYKTRAPRPNEKRHKTMKARTHISIFTSVYTGAVLISAKRTEEAAKATHRYIHYRALLCEPHWFNPFYCDVVAGELPTTLCQKLSYCKCVPQRFGTRPAARALTPGRDTHGHGLTPANTSILCHPRVHNPHASS